MAGLNQVILSGRIPSWNESIKIYNENDEKKACVVTTVCVATTRKDDNGYYVTDNIPVKIFGKQAQTFAKIVQPGAVVIIQGKFAPSVPFKDAKGNTAYSSPYVSAWTWSFQESAIGAAAKRDNGTKQASPARNAAYGATASRTTATAATPAAAPASVIDSIGSIDTRMLDELM